MKKIFSFIITLAIIIVLSSPHNLYASDIDAEPEIITNIIYFDNGDYLETTIISSFQSLSNTASTLSNTKNGTKTSTYRNSSGDALWSVSVTGTFTYTGQSCACTSVNGESTSYSSYWKVSGVTTSKSGNKATAKATGKKYLLGIQMQSHDVSVTLTCSNSGVLS